LNNEGSNLFTQGNFRSYKTLRDTYSIGWTIASCFSRIKLDCKHYKKEIDKMANLIDKKYILHRIGKALDYQFEIYSWEQMIDDALDGDFSEEEIKWAKENICYKAYILE
jgi:hypothetical protein